MIDKCPYVFCPNCKQSNSWVRDSASDIIGQETGNLLWRGWRCKYCGDVAKQPVDTGIKIIIGRVTDNG